MLVYRLIIWVTPTYTYTPTPKHKTTIIIFYIIGTVLASKFEPVVALFTIFHKSYRKNIFHTLFLLICMNDLGNEFIKFIFSTCTLMQIMRIHNDIQNGSCPR